MGVIHSHTRHYMPLGKLDKGNEKTGLVFDAFLSLPAQAEVIVAWPEVVLDDELFGLASDLASGINYLGRAESWAVCEALSSWDEKPNCFPAGENTDGQLQRVLAPVTLAKYQDERQQLLSEARERIRASKGDQLSEKKLDTELKKMFRVKKTDLTTLPESLVKALSLDTGDYQGQWNRPPASQEVLYDCDEKVLPGVMARLNPKSSSISQKQQDLPTVARYVLAGRPRPKIEDAVRIGETMRKAVMSKFGYEEARGKKIPKAPKEISGRDAEGGPIQDPLHPHAFWLPEDADGDGLD